MKFRYEAARPGANSLVSAFSGRTRQDTADETMKSLANVDYLRSRMGESDAKARDINQRSDYLGNQDKVISDSTGIPLPLVGKFTEYMKHGDFGQKPLGPDESGNEISGPGLRNTEIPADITPLMESLKKGARLYGNTRSSESSNPIQLAQAAGEFQGQDATQYVQDKIIAGDIKGASAYNQGSKLGNEIKDSENIARIGAQSRVDVADKRQISTPAQKMKGDKDRAKELTNLDVSDKFTNALITNIDQLIGSEDGKVPAHPGLKGSTGWMDIRVPPINEDQANARALINSLLSKTSVQGLTGIRSTGTAPGSITEKEWPIFQNTLSTVDPSQGTPQFTQQLKDLRTISREFKNTAKFRFDERFGTEDQKQPAASSAVDSPRGGLSAEEQAELEQLRKEMKSGR